MNGTETNRLFLIEKLDSNPELLRKSLYFALGRWYDEEEKLDQVLLEPGNFELVFRVGYSLDRGKLTIGRYNSLTAVITSLVEEILLEELSIKREKLFVLAG